MRFKGYKAFRFKVRAVCIALKTYERSDLATL